MGWLDTTHDQTVICQCGFWKKNLAHHLGTKTASRQVSKSTTEYPILTNQRNIQKISSALAHKQIWRVLSYWTIQFCAILLDLLKPPETTAGFTRSQIDTLHLLWWMLSTFERNPLGVWAADIDDIHDIHLSALCCWSLGIAQKFRLVDGLLIDTLQVVTWFGVSMIWFYTIKKKMKQTSQWHHNDLESLWSVGHLKKMRPISTRQSRSRAQQCTTSRVRG